MDEQMHSLDDIKEIRDSADIQLQVQLQEFSPEFSPGPCPLEQKRASIEQVREADEVAETPPLKSNKSTNSSNNARSSKESPSSQEVAGFLRKCQKYLE